MINIRKENFVRFKDTENGMVSVVKAELDCDTAADLPAADGIEGRELLMGSIAWDISTGDFYGLGSDGAWYKQDGSGAYDPDEAEPDAMNSKLNRPTAGETIEQADVPVDLTEEHDSEGKRKIMEEIPETETLESKEVIKDAEPLRDTESE